MHTKLKYQPPGIQFIAFMGIAAFFLVFTATISFFLFGDVATVLQNSKAIITPDIVTKFKVVQLVSALLTFIVPAFLFARLSSNRPFAYAGLHNVFTPGLLILSVILLFAVQPFVGWLGNINAKIHFGSLHDAFKASEARYNKVLETFLKMDSVAGLLSNLFLMALLPAVGEELFFRGSLQKVLLRWSRIPWLSVLISSLIFAFLHGTVFKVLPIFTLGIMLGTVYYVTRNLWYCIIIHFINNAIAVLAVYFSNSSDTIKKLAGDNMTYPIYSALISLGITIAIIYSMKKQSDIALPAYTVDEDQDYIA